MICMPALNLFFYNGLMVYIAREIIRIIKVPTTNVSGWHQIPIIGWFFSPHPPDKDNEFLDYQEFDDVLWNLNLYVNGLLLLPALCQIHHFSVLVAGILMWNFYVYQRLFAFFLRLAWYLSYSDLCWAYYGPLVMLGLLLNTLHLGLIVGTMKWQAEYLEELQPQPRPAVGSHSPPRQEQRLGAEVIEAIGDCLER
ncbi:uncharacterized protein LOC108053846 [Drosophila rhopaloa]|uniref:Uncharacterized protein LOC108053846 n=1 Tax=Drosophila rhopaloa TaxID=1041015 RepID=A0A6P4G3B7_DRORH|nr:uncharacterized protein LOC108053846 [Drosophila rhopaloa]